MPCLTQVCQEYSISPIAAPLGVPLAWFGAGMYLTLTALGAVFVFRHSRSVYNFALAFAVVGTLVSLGLNLYGILSYGDFCPWCSASMACVLVVLGSLLCIEPKGKRPGGGGQLASSLFVSLTAAFLILIILDRSQRPRLVDQAYLDSVDLSELLPNEREFGETQTVAPSDNRYLVIVDLGCGACREHLKKIRDANLGPNTCVRFTSDTSEYGRSAALLYLDARNAGERNAALIVVLSDESRTTGTINRARSRMLGNVEPTSIALSQLQLDKVFVSRLGAHGVPLLIRVGDESRRLIKAKDLPSSP